MIKSKNNIELVAKLEELVKENEKLKNEVEEYFEELLKILTSVRNQIHTNYK